MVERDLSWQRVEPAGSCIFPRPILATGLLPVLAVSLLPSWPNLAAGNCNVDAAVATAMRWVKWEDPARIKGPVKMPKLRIAAQSEMC